ncbi:hypothetical protein ACEPAI_657 [Sanghuangporus weigelae]
MPWSVSRRWNISLPRLVIHRFLVLSRHSPLLRPFWATRRQSSSASANALLRLDASTSAQHQPSQRYNVEQSLSDKKQVDKGNIQATNREKNFNPEIPAYLIPNGLLLWMDEHFAVLTDRDFVRKQFRQRQDWLRFLENGESVCRAAKHLMRAGVPWRVFELLKVAHSLGIAFEQGVYERIVSHLSTTEEWKLALLIIAAAENVTGTTTVRLLHLRGLALIKVQNFVELDDLLGQFAKHGLKPQDHTFVLILRGHLLNHDLARAKVTIRDMEAAGFPMTASTYSAIVPAYRGFGLDDFIRDRGCHVLSSNPVPEGGERILNGLLQMHLDKHDLEGALQLLENFGSQTRTCGAEKSSSVSGNAEDSIDTGNISYRSILEDCATYTILINYLSKYGPSSLTGMLKRMRNSAIVPDIKVGSALIRMHYARGEEHEALAVLRDCCKGHDFHVDLLESLGYVPERADPSMFSPFIGQPTTELFNAVLHGALQIRGLGATIAVLRLMEDARVKPNVRTLEHFMRRLAKERAILTKDLANIMQSLLATGIEPSLGTLHILFKSIVLTVKRSEHKEGWNALGAYTRRSIELLQVPDTKRQRELKELKRAEPTFDPELCVTDLQSNVFHDVLRPIVQSLHRRRVMADRATFSLRMRYDSFTLGRARAPEAVTQNLQIMRDRGLYPNVYHYAALMEAHCLAGNLRAAHEVLRNAVADGLVSHQKSLVVLYTILISANARNGRPDLALSIFREMLNANVAPDIASIDALVGGFFAVKAFRLARRVLLDLWPLVAPFPMELRDASLIDLITRLRSLRDQAEPPSQDVKRPIALSRRELMKLNQDIIANWNDVLQARHEHKQCGDDPGEENSPSYLDVLREAGSRQEESPS